MYNNCDIINGGQPYLVPWPAVHPMLHGQLGKLTGLPMQAAQPAATHPLTQFPQFTALTLSAAGAAGQIQHVYPLTAAALSLPPSLLTHNVVTSLPKLMIPGVKVR